MGAPAFMAGASRCASEVARAAGISRQPIIPMATAALCPWADCADILARGGCAQPGPHGRPWQFRHPAHLSRHTENPFAMRFDEPNKYGNRITPNLPYRKQLIIV